MVVARTQPKQRLTLEEFLALPEEKPALEYLDGVVTQKVSPERGHSEFQYVIPERINTFAYPRKLAFAFPELRTTLGGASFVPDVAVYRWDRIPRTRTARGTIDVSTPPDIAIEIASPGQGCRALLDRCWIAAGGTSSTARGSRCWSIRGVARSTSSAPAPSPRRCAATTCSTSARWCPA